MVTPRHARQDDARRTRARGVAFWAGLGLGVGAVLLVGAFVWDGIHLLSSKDALTQHAAAAKQALLDRDAGALSVEVAALEDSAGAFAAATAGPHWWLAAHTPWVGDQASPLMAAGEAVDTVARDALAPIAALGDLDALEAPAFEDGRIDPLTLEPYRDALAGAAATLHAQVAALAGVDMNGTVDQVAAPFADLRQQIGTLADIVQGGHVTAELLPSMLGSDGPRTYLVMVQNNAEPRTTGGIPGAVIEVTVDDGRMTQGRYASASDLTAPEGVGGLTEDEERIFTRRMEVYPQDVTFTPELPRSAEMMARFWERAYGESVTGVISVDPVALGWMLEGASPTEVGGFSITSENLADVMLNQAYLEYPDPADQDAFFAMSSAALFGRIVSGDAQVLSGVERAIESGRFLIWSADTAEQDLLASTPVAGAFLERKDALGVFFNDGSGSKIGYYIDTETSITNHLCTDGTLAAQTVELTLSHNFTGDVSALPHWVSGGGDYVPPAEFHANVLLYPAAGTGVANLTRDGNPAQLNGELHDGRSITSVRVVLEPGQTTTLVYELTAFESGLLMPTLVETPGPKPKVNAQASDTVAEGIRTLGGNHDPTHHRSDGPCGRHCARPDRRAGRRYLPGPRGLAHLQQDGDRGLHHRQLHHRWPEWGFGSASDHLLRRRRDHRGHRDLGSQDHRQQRR